MKGLKMVVALIALSLATLVQAVEPGPQASGATEQSHSQAVAAGQQINLNTADADQLQSLKGVGPATAQAIIQWREANGPFTSVDQLMAVKGIGEKNLARMRDSLTIQ